jgi:hypothetical protein
MPVSLIERLRHTQQSHLVAVLLAALLALLWRHLLLV